MREFARIKWSEEDLEESLLREGFEPSHENVEKLLGTRLSKTLEEQSIMVGWDVINDIIHTTEGLVKISE